MKAIYFSAVALFLSITGMAQVEGASKLYGYKQEVMPGTIRVDENGNQVRPKPRYNYFIYLSSSTKVIPTEVWIDGKAYSVNASPVAKTPVEYKNPTSTEKAKILVPKTTRFVLQLLPVAELSQASSKGKTLSEKNQLVVIYKGGQKNYYKALAKFTMLEMLAMQ
jgi:hypothetical protein